MSIEKAKAQLHVESTRNQNKQLSIPGERQKYELDGTISSGKVVSIDISKIIPTEPHAIEPDNATAQSYADGLYGQKLTHPNQLPPIVLSNDNKIIDGNNRYAAAKLAHLDKINCVVVDQTYDQYATAKHGKNWHTKVATLVAPDQKQKTQPSVSPSSVPTTAREIRDKYKQSQYRIDEYERDVLDRDIHTNSIFKHKYRRDTPEENAASDLSHATGQPKNAPIRTVPVDHIYPLQSGLDSEAVARYFDNPSGNEPSLIKVGPKKYLTYDGHHRIAAKIIQGHDKIDAHVVDMTSDPEIRQRFERLVRAYKH